MRSGRVDGTIIIANERTTIEGVVDAKGVEIGSVSLAAPHGQCQACERRRPVRARLSGRRGANFEFVTLADISKDQIRLTGQGNIDRQALVLNQAAVLTRSGDGWALGQTESYLFRWIGDSFGAKRLGA